MPTEHEYKYLLSLDVANENLLLFDDLGVADIHSVNKTTGLELCRGMTAEFRQGYLAVSDDMNLRVRHSIMSCGESWVLTFKQKIPGRQIEIEQKLETRDALDLWEISTRKLKKVRHFFEISMPVESPSVTPIARVRQMWELDLFYGPDLYFAMMEVEVREGAARPELPESLEFLKKHILYEVPLTDDRFSNKNLGDVAFATDLYKQIQQGETDGYKNQKEEGL